MLRATWPLTGLDADGAAPSYPPLVVKFDNTYASRPQIGLRKADLVTEELVEGGLTRLAAFYESRVPGVVGPVRSMRASDIGVVKPVDATIVTSGAASPTIARLRKAGVSFRENGATGFYRDNGRAAPYNLFVQLTRLAGTLKAPKKVPQPYLSWGKEKDFPGGAGAKSVQARFSRGHTTEWSYRGGKYVNTNTNAAAGKDFQPDTIVVVRVRQGNAGYLDPAGNPVPGDDLQGHRQGRRVPQGQGRPWHLEQVRSHRGAGAEDPGREAEGAGRSHLDRAAADGPRRRPPQLPGLTRNRS